MQGHYGNVFMKSIIRPTEHSAPENNIRVNLIDLIRQSKLIYTRMYQGKLNAVTLFVRVRMVFL
jgi:hypothetical protein